MTKHEFPNPHWDEGCVKCGSFGEEPCEPPVPKMKASEIFEGENSSLKKTFDEAMRERTVDEIVEAIQAKKRFRKQETNERNTKYFTRLSQHRDTIDDIIQTITQPNNK